MAAVPPSGFTARRWRLTTLLRPNATEFWLYYPPSADGAMQTLKVCLRDGYDLAVLHWETCHACRRGRVAKIRVTSDWQRRGYATRMMARAMRGCLDYEWTTTPQMEDGRHFFPVLSSAVGTSLADRGEGCEHMHVHHPHSRYRPRLERPSTADFGR